MDKASREMTLAEYVRKLPECNAAHQEYQTLVSVEEAAKQACPACWSGVPCFQDEPGPQDDVWWHRGQNGRRFMCDASAIRDIPSERVRQESNAS